MKKCAWCNKEFEDTYIENGIKYFCNVCNDCRKKEDIPVAYIFGGVRLWQTKFN